MNNEGSYINHDYITDYIRDVIPERVGLLNELEQYAAENHVPIVQPEVARLLSVLVNMIQPSSILEIGTAIGYSSILLAQGLKPGGKLITIERYNKMVCMARENIKRASLENTIHVIEGEAEEVLADLNGEFDFIFMDAAKGHYMEFFHQCMRMLRPKGVLVSDNVLYKGMIASDKLVIRRKKTIVKRMRDYLVAISNHPELDTAIIPIGDGLAISYRK